MQKKDFVIRRKSIYFAAEKPKKIKLCQTLQQK